MPSGKRWIRESRSFLPQADQRICSRRRLKQMKEFIIISHLLGQELWIITQGRSYIRRSCHQKTERQCARYLKEKISTQRLLPMEKFTWKNPLMIIWSVIRFRLTMYGSLKKNGRLRWKNHPSISWNMELV